MSEAQDFGRAPTDAERIAALEAEIAEMRALLGGVKKPKIDCLSNFRDITIREMINRRNAPLRELDVRGIVNGVLKVVTNHRRITDIPQVADGLARDVITEIVAALDRLCTKAEAADPFHFCNHDPILGRRTSEMEAGTFSPSTIKMLREIGFQSGDLNAPLFARDRYPHTERSSLRKSLDTGLCIAGLMPGKRLKPMIKGKPVQMADEGGNS